MFIVTLVFLLFIVNAFFWSCLSDVFDFDNDVAKEKKELFELPLFWLAVMVPSSVSVIMIGYLCYDEFEHYQSVAKLDGFVLFFKAPLSALAMMIPAIAMVASNHRSVQSAAQVEQAIAQYKQSMHVADRAHYDQFRFWFIDSCMDSEFFKKLSLKKEMQHICLRSFTLRRYQIVSIMLAL